VVVKFADTQKDKDQRRHHQIQSSMIANFTAPTPSMNAIAPQSYFTVSLVSIFYKEEAARSIGSDFRRPPSYLSTKISISA
jgi:hypothetical protein